MQTIKPLPKKILATLLGMDERVTKAGIIIAGENGKERGIRPRWAKIQMVGEKIDWVTPGQYVLVAHGRWSNQTTIEHNGKDLKLVLLDNDEILAVQDEAPFDDFIGRNTSTAPDSIDPSEFLRPILQ